MTGWQSPANVARWGMETDWYIVAIPPTTHEGPFRTGQTLSDRGTYDDMLRAATALKARNPDVEYHVNRGGSLGARL